MKVIPHKELANNYGVTPTTLTRWIKRLGILNNDKTKVNRNYSPKELEVIYNKLGNPSKDNE
jgi:hypothetical protein